MCFVIQLAFGSTIGFCEPCAAARPAKAMLTTVARILRRVR